VTSRWVKWELLYALQQDHYQNKIIPLLYRSCDYEPLSWTLSIFEFVDFRNDLEQACRDLLRIWGIGYRAE
jgi:hypothetical protein